MASTTRKPPPTTPNPTRRHVAPVAPHGRQSPALSSASTPISARRNSIRDSSIQRGSVNGGSPLSARSAVKTRPSIEEIEQEHENNVILEDIRSRLAKSESAAEAAAEEYAKQIKALQLRLDELHADNVRLEDTTHSKEDTIEGLEMQIKDLTRSRRDQENIYEAERIAAQQEKEEFLDREEEQNTIIQRLKDTLAQRQAVVPERDSFERDSDESNTFAPSGHSQAPQNGLLLQKDKLIESLRLELAEAQIRLAEADHLGGSKVQQIEQQLLDVRMTNARLMEDNESFQLLLSSAALNGEFPRGDYLSNAFSDLEPEMNDAKKVQGSPRNSLSLNLAEELNEVEEEDTEKLKKVETELKSLKEQNKAMSLYISGIIERILQHKDSEAILDKTISLAGPEKPLTPTLTSMPENSVIGVNSAIGVHRTRSLAQRRIPPPFRPENMPGALQRSQSYRGPGGGHKRSQSDVGHIFTGAPGAPGAPGVSGVNNIYRGEGSITPRASFYGNEHYSRSRPRDSSASVDSGVSDTSSINSHSYPSTPIGPITGNKLRPLSLVQKNVNNGMMSPTGSRRISGDYMDHDDSRFDKRSNKRNSWMGWFNRKEDMPGGIAESVVFEGKDVE